MVSATATPSLLEHPVRLLRDLIRFDTTNPPGNETECIAYINDLLTSAGFETTILARDPNRPNLIARLEGEGSAPPLLLYGHVDVVTTAHQEWTHPPFEANVIEGFIWGRGALDMKGGVAMMLAALLRAKAEGYTPAGDVLLVLLSDEENGGNFGARYLVECHAPLFEDVRYALGEFGGFSMHMGGTKFYPIQVAEKQVCWMKGIIRGPSGHGALPLRGGAMGKLGHMLIDLDQHRLPVHITPATRAMIDGIAKAMRFPGNLIVRQLLQPLLTNRIVDLLGETGRTFDAILHNTVNVTVVRGGEKINVTPGEIVVEVDGRLLPGFTPADLISELRGVIGNDVDFEVILYDPLPGEPDMGWFDTLAGILRDADPNGVPIPMVLPAVTDARFFSRLGIQTYGFMPMNLPAEINFVRTIHGVDERIPVAAVAFGTELIFRALQHYGR